MQNRKLHWLQQGTRDVEGHLRLGATGKNFSSTVQGCRGEGTAMCNVGRYRGTKKIMEYSEGGFGGYVHILVWLLLRMCAGEWRR